MPGSNYQLYDTAVLSYSRDLTRLVREVEDKHSGIAGGLNRKPKLRNLIRLSSV